MSQRFGFSQFPCDLEECWLRLRRGKTPFGGSIGEPTSPGEDCVRSTVGSSGTLSAASADGIGARYCGRSIAGRAQRISGYPPVQRTGRASCTSSVLAYWQSDHCPAGFAVALAAGGGGRGLERGVPFVGAARDGGV